VNNGRIRRYLGRMEGSPGIYAGLPAEIALKTPATDPFPPNRAGQAPGVFYQQQFDIEFLSQPNEIVEDLDHLPRDPVPHPVPRPEGPYSTLDSLYKATATSLQPDTGSAAVQSVVMTYYHSGADNPPFVLTGFNLWSFRRSDSVALVDFVLQQLWGMARGASASVSAAPARGNGIEPVAGPGRPQQASASAGAAGVARRN
jgi:hypothetical protein